MLPTRPHLVQCYQLELESICGKHTADVDDAMVKALLSIDNALLAAG